MIEIDFYFKNNYIEIIAKIFSIAQPCTVTRTSATHFKIEAYRYDRLATLYISENKCTIVGYALDFFCMDDSLDLFDINYDKDITVSKNDGEFVYSGKAFLQSMIDNLSHIPLIIKKLVPINTFFEMNAPSVYILGALLKDHLFVDAEIAYYGDGRLISFVDLNAVIQHPTYTKYKIISNDDYWNGEKRSQAVDKFEEILGVVNTNEENIEPGTYMQLNSRYLEDKKLDFVLDRLQEKVTLIRNGEVGNSYIL